ncbi:copper resistance CopC family protein [Deinococcus actinosclerus]|uniref:Copper resistance protein CopC n=1 Tax=Deinococcus actinosclerus TaxID=1768108 RepID=A0ABN4K5W9_9DEIO|nr:copper resistance CopC family protein [Deinococcus actinosclerus]ALW88289.1 copper resistance protein CopC [Deinococcus actinosclerus]
MKNILPLLAALTLSAASAHTAVSGVTPALNATVTAPKTVTLAFSEPVELRFSTFRVMAVPAGVTVAEAARRALAEKADSAALANRPASLSGAAARLALTLKPNLKSGQYVIAWKILSEDGHPVTGQSTFRVK